MFRSLIFTLVFLSLFIAGRPLQPQPHRRRNSCHSHTSINIPLAGTPTNVNINPTSSDPNSRFTPKPTKSPSAHVTGSLFGALFPVSDITDSWTTSTSSKGHLPLSDATFHPTNLLKGLSHNYVAAPDGKMSMQAHYPEGSYTFNHEPQGGFSFYAAGPSNVDLATAREATLGYSVFFEEGFQFNMGGKMPGLYGGDTHQEATGCSDGSCSSACFSTRLMWRSGGAGEFYTYFPPNAANDKQCSVAPESKCNPTYGASVGRGAFMFATGKWTTVSERVRLNTVGKADGEIELFVNGDSIINVQGLVLRDSDSSKFRGIMMQTFFGGHTSDYASPKAQNAYFSDFSVAITDTF